MACAQAHAFGHHCFPKRLSRKGYKAAHYASTVDEVLSASSQGRVGVAFSENRLPDGRSWKDMLARLQELPHHPPIVKDRLSDEALWAEVHLVVTPGRVKLAGDQRLGRVKLDIANTQFPPDSRLRIGKLVGSAREAPRRANASHQPGVVERDCATSAGSLSLAGRVA